MKQMSGHGGGLALWLLDKLAGWPSGTLVSERVRRHHLAKWSLLAATMAMAGPLLQHRTALSCVSSSSHSASSCGRPRSSSCSVTSATPGELRTTCGVTRVEPLRAAGSEVAAPAPVEEKDGPNLPCDTCNSKGWLVCDFCKGQKTNVQVRANKFYRRCPSCRAVGVVICPQCKVFKCVTCPDGVDGY